ncbi:hypothetical protein THAOC_21970 [Thalassiosira oceanica]|uniref:Uncharacterized protein n=1 Tax=Thalassiosira oceanica TaxID=159749 RepID=K0SAE1_THAOC|nr:hypothetical protein THAOC_21970 [Thalassiosira oceanica]|eukprot:EJK57946.1 hypothetical protein THAOC_21970 [Thalassiosira oceanica]
MEDSRGAGWMASSTPFRLSHRPLPGPRETPTTAHPIFEYLQIGSLGQCLSIGLAAGAQNVKHPRGDHSATGNCHACLEGGLMKLQAYIHQADGIIPRIPECDADVFGSFVRHCIEEISLTKVGWLVRPPHNMTSAHVYYLTDLESEPTIAWQCFHAFFVKVYINEEWEYLRQCKVGARKSEQDEESRIAQVLESGMNVPTIQAELDGAPVPVDLTMEEFADAIPSR